MDIAASRKLVERREENREDEARRVMMQLMRRIPESEYVRFVDADQNPLGVVEIIEKDNTICVVLD